MHSMSMIPEEEEILFPAGSSFFVRSIDVIGSYPPTINLEAKIYY
jgi:hypothetical protein